ncbi:hypothetical protein [Bacillus cereus]|uniref:hypothetical protein n=1 Tax=Bacillus cereus TaxID=1396 RepID=UPI0012F7A76E|nr:hypothetical protein [Bacillus cereus]
MFETMKRKKDFELEFEKIDQDLYFSNTITFEHIKDHFRFVGAIPYRGTDRKTEKTHVKQIST